MFSELVFARRWPICLVGVSWTSNPLGSVTAYKFWIARCSNRIECLLWLALSRDLELHPEIWDGLGLWATNGAAWGRISACG